MILGELRDEPGQAASRATLDDVFRRAAMRWPTAVALADPPNRQAFTHGAPRQLTFAETDQVVSAIAARLRQMGLTTDAIVALQLPNTVESVLTLLGVLRAGLIAMPIPLLWRRADAVAAMSRVGARALISGGRVGGVDHGELALHLAAETFTIRYVCAFGDKLPDGVISLEDLFEAAPIGPLPRAERSGNPAAHLAVITWDVTADGLVPVARSHAELLAGGIAVVLEARIEQGAAIMGSLLTASFAGLATTVMPWLLVGGTLTLHHPFDPTAFAAQRKIHDCGTVVVPGSLLGRMADAELLAPGHGLKQVIAVWRAPERLASGAAWPHPDVSVIDVHTFGETGFYPARRSVDGKPARIRLGQTSTSPAAALSTIEVVRTLCGTVALRGPMVPRLAFPADAEQSGLPFFKTVAGGFADTGYTCRIELDETMVVTGAPVGLVSVGGYRFPAHELQTTVAQAGGGGRLAPLPDPLCGQRLAGSAEDRERLQAALAEAGVNPLVTGAFDGRPAGTAAAVSAA